MDFLIDHKIPRSRVPIFPNLVNSNILVAHFERPLAAVHLQEPAR